MKTVDLFAGCGGMSLGFQNAGFDIVAAYDNWHPAVAIYRKNFSHPIFERDLADESIVGEISAYAPEIIIGGPPCQDFSSAGHRDETLGRAELSKRYTDIVCTAKPRFFVMENVARIRVSQTYHATGNLLIMGGPGSGKTTIALFKAKDTIEKGELKKGQKILFLSFARATISRVEEHAGALIPSEIKSSIEINTYHGFIWNILHRHGYLLIDKPLKLLPPHEVSTKMAGVKKEDIPQKALDLFEESGIVHFDIFASLCKKLLEKRQELLKNLCQCDII